MGKGVIVEHLGDAHYRIGLDIDVSYARDQLAAINLYLDEFAAKYQEATDAKNEAQAALAPINARLTEYLADAQAASQAAYDAMVAAYDAWVDAVANQPDPEIIAPLREAMDVWFDGFATTHNDYILALDGDPQAELPVPDALESRTHALQQLTLAMGDWLGAVGALIDPEAVNAAFDALGLALDNFEAATVAYAADPGNATLKSAMNYYRGVYESAHSDWVLAVDDNSGDEYVKAARDAYDAAAETFDAARAALGKLLDNGGMPPELADIMAEQERAYATYHGALQNWQSLTLIKTEKETAKAELMSRLLPFTNNDGEPVRQTVNAWCCDATEDIAVGAEVATIEIPSERDLGVRVRPAYESRETYSAARDGKLQPSWSSSPEATYWNWALHPGNARWHPNYRLGEILFIDPLTDKCTVQLDPQRNNEKSRARDGNTLDVINPVKYQIDPDTGEQTTILPGDNVQVADGVTTLTDVPIEYMECNAAVFEVGDHVMVEFQSRDWKQPKVIGFAENPRSCNVHGLVLTANVITPSTTSNEGLFLKDTAYGAEGVFNHPASSGGGSLQGGNIDWMSADGKNVLTWKGPMGRAISPRILTWASGSTSPPDFDPASYYSHLNMHLVDGSPANGNYDNRFLTSTRWGSELYLNGKSIGVAPTASPYLIGASLVTFDGVDSQGNPITKKYIVGVFVGRAGASLPSSTGYYYPVTSSIVTHVYYWANLPATGQTLSATDWHQVHSQDFGGSDQVLPPATPCFFSGSGLKFACCVPTGIGNVWDSNSGMFADSRVVCGNDVIVMGTVTPSADDVSISTTVTWQDDGNGSWSVDYSASGPPDGETQGSYSKSRYESINESSSAICAIDFIGEDEVTLTATRTRLYSLTSDVSGYQTGYPDYTGDDSGSQNDNYQNQESVTLRDEYRNKTVGAYSYSDSRTVTAGAVNGLGTYELSVTAIASLNQPIYYDLRYGACVNEDSSVSRSYLTTSVYSLSGGGGFTIATTNINNDAWALKISDRFNVAYVDESSALDRSETTYTSSSTGLRWSASNESSYTFGSYTPQSACDAARSPWWAAPDSYSPDDANFTKISVPVWNILHCNTAGDVVGNIKPTYPVKPSCNNQFVDFGFFNALSVVPVTIHAVFSSAFDIDMAWQDHLNTKHPQPEGEDPIIMTALEADIKPEFRR